MITHIVVFKLKDSAEGRSKSENAIIMKKMLEDLIDKIDVLKSMKVGLDVLHSDRSFDIGLIAEFDNLDDLAIYANHPDHLEAVEFIRKVRTESISVDWQS